MSISQRDSKTLRQIYHVLPDLCAVFNDYKAKMYSATLEGERLHRRFRPDSMPCGISKDLAAQYFVIKFLKAAVEEKREQLDAGLALKVLPEVMMSYALASQFAPELKLWYDAQDWVTFDKLDYAEMMS